MINLDISPNPRDKASNNELTRFERTISVSGWLYYSSEKRLKRIELMNSWAVLPPGLSVSSVCWSWIPVWPTELTVTVCRLGICPELILTGVEPSEAPCPMENVCTGANVICWAGVVWSCKFWRFWIPWTWRGTAGNFWNTISQTKTTAILNLISICIWLLYFEYPLSIDLRKST